MDFSSGDHKNFKKKLLKSKHNIKKKFKILVTNTFRKEFNDLSVKEKQRKLKVFLLFENKSMILCKLLF